jgi:DNA polymerase III delta prime subunit
MLIPDSVSEFGSEGERKLYQKFKLDGSTKNMYVLHSVFTSHHIKNISGELDFLVLVPNEGFFCIEVKHGGVSRKNGEWCFSNRLGETNCKKTGPFAQQSATMNSIRNFVLKKLKHKTEMHARFEKFLWGSGVAFTSMSEFIDFGPEGHSWQVLTKQGLKLPIGTYIDTLSKGSHREQSNKFWYDANKARPTKKDCEDLVKILRGDFKINYSEISRMIDNEAIIEDYTKEQFALLDFVNYNSRCLIAGGAGTGKTLMALELAKRKSNEKLKGGLLCFNHRLGDKLSNAIENMTSHKDCIIFCGTLHKYMVNQVNSLPPKNSSDHQVYFSKNLPLEFLIEYDNFNESDKLDFLILDEAQDLLTPNYLEVFDCILKGGLRNGNWVMFGDFSNQAIYSNDPLKCFELLNSYSSFTRFPPLKTNCRNTICIAEQNTLLTGAELPEFTYRNLKGNIVTCKYPKYDDQTKEIELILLEIEKRGIPLIKVTLLSPKAIENSVISEYEPILTLIKKGVQYSTIQGFKGLENNIIVLFDFDDVYSKQMQRLLYVGISRATQELYLVLRVELQSSIIELIQGNYKKTTSA